VLNKFKIGTRLAAGFSMLLFFIVLMSILGIGGIYKLNQQLVDITSINNAEIQAATDMSSAVNQIAVTIRNLVMETELSEKKAQIEHITSQTKKYKDAIEYLAELYKTPGTTEVEINLLGKIQKNEAIALPLISKTSTLVLNNQTDEARKLLRDEVKSAQGKWLDEINEVMITEQRRNDAAATEAGKTYILVRNISLAAVTAAFIIGFVLAVLITRSITKPIKKMTEQIAAGDLVGEATATSKDEIGALVHEMQKMNTGLRNVILQVRDNSEKITAVATELSASSSQVSASSFQQSEAASSMASDVEETTVSISQISEHANDAHTISAELSTLSKAGSTIIHDTITEMRVIADSVNESSTVVQELASKSEQISNVVKVIREVADQTNLLALNAAIEAARAGEQGRGFAVVADEVRKLAERTAHSSMEISTTTEQIRSNIGAVLNGLQSCVERVNKGVAKASQAENSITQINAGAQKVVHSINDISAALTEQSMASTDIAKHVERVANMAESNHSTVDKTTKTVQHLEKLAVDLYDLVKYFKV